MNSQQAVDSVFMASTQPCSNCGERYANHTPTERRRGCKRHADKPTQYWAVALGSTGDGCQPVHEPDSTDEETIDVLLPVQELRSENARLRALLAEAEETILTLRMGADL